MIKLKGGTRVDFSKVIAYAPKGLDGTALFLEGGQFILVNNTLEELDTIRENLRQQKERRDISNARGGVR
jgi:hypothetical protein